jgi:triosephosphate isomerase
MYSPFLIAGNWKMSGSRGQWAALTRDILAQAQGLKPELAIFPPFIALPEVEATLSGSPILALGAQDVAYKEVVASTGEISATMLKAYGCQYVLVGHSERRRDQHEDNIMVAEKIRQCHLHRMTPIVCLGETQAQRAAGRAIEVIDLQFLDAIETLNISEPADLVIAYEPVWAIGSGQTPTLEQLTEVFRFLRASLIAKYGEMGYDIRILYGGSVSPDNATAYLDIQDLGGYLVGGASLKANSFVAIAQAVQSYRKL